MNKYCFLGNYTESDEILVTMERYQEYYQDALEAMEQLSNTRQLILESRSINDRELRLVQQGALGWAKYFEIEHKVTPALEMHSGKSNKQIALETVKAVDIGLFAIAAAILGWILSMFASLFGFGGSSGGGGSGGGGGASGLTVTQVDTIKAVRQSIKNNSVAIQTSIDTRVKDGKASMDTLGLKALGLKGDHVTIDEIHTFVKHLADISVKTSRACARLGDAVSDMLKSFKADPTTKVDLQAIAKIHEQFIPRDIHIDDAAVTRLGVHKDNNETATGLEVVKDFIYVLVIAKEAEGGPTFKGVKFIKPLDYEPAGAVSLVNLDTRKIDNCLALCLDIDTDTKNNAKAMKKLQENSMPVQELATRLAEAEKRLTDAQEKEEMKKQAHGLLTISTLAKSSMFFTATLNSCVTKLLGGIVTTLKTTTTTTK